MNIFKQIAEEATRLKGYLTINYLKSKSIVLNKPMSLTDVVNTYNQTYVRRFPAGTGAIDAQISKNSPARNAIIANLIATEAKKANLDPIYLAACIMQESEFSEACFNHNLKEHNGVETFEGTDWGLTQQSGNYLPERPGMPPKPNISKMTTTEAASAVKKWQTDMAALACTAEWAVPTMATIMAGNVKYFTKYINENLLFAANLKSLNTTSLTDVQFASTTAYNSGISGAIKKINSKIKANMPHPYEVASHYADFVRNMK